MRRLLPANILNLLPDIWFLRDAKRQKVPLEVFKEVHRRVFRVTIVPKVVVCFSTQVPMLDLSCRQHRRKMFVNVFDLAIHADVMYQLARVQVIPIVFNNTLRTISPVDFRNKVLPSLCKTLAATAPNALGAALSFKYFLI